MINKLICNNCKIELIQKNVKDVKFGRTYEMINGEEIEIEQAYIECNNCGTITEAESYIGYGLLVNEEGNLYNFNDLAYLLEHLSEEDKEKIKDCTFIMHEEHPDDDSGDVYYCITIYKDDNEIGKIDMQCHSNYWYNIATDEYVVNEDQKIYYTYTMNLNIVESTPNKLIRKPQNIGFNTSVCKKCGQIFCDCNLKCKICGQVFCLHKSKF